MSILPFFQYALIGLLIFLAFLAVRYLWSLYKEPGYWPKEWLHKVKEGSVPKELIKLARQYPDKVRFFAFWLQVERLKRENIVGAFAELGVYRGETARILHKMDPGRKLHLFDTFEGFPATDLTGETGEAATYTPKNFADTTPESVKEYIGGNDNVVIHKGYFPDTTKGLEDEKFAFVNLDADLYRPTSDALSFFYPRLSPGGVIFIHDYNQGWQGVVKAVNEFCNTIPEVAVELPDIDSTVMIIKNRTLAR